MRYQWKINQFLNALVHLSLSRSLSLSLYGGWLPRIKSIPLQFPSILLQFTSISIRNLWVPNTRVGGAQFDYSLQVYILHWEWELGCWNWCYHRTLASSGVSQDTPDMPKYNMTMAVLRLLFMRTVLSCVEFLNDGLASLGHLRLAMRNGGQGLILFIVRFGFGFGGRWAFYRMPYRALLSKIGINNRLVMSIQIWHEPIKSKPLTY